MTSFFPYVYTKIKFSSNGKLFCPFSEIPCNYSLNIYINRSGWRNVCYQDFFGIQIQCSKSSVNNCIEHMFIVNLFTNQKGKIPALPSMSHVTIMQFLYSKSTVRLFLTFGSRNIIYINISFEREKREEGDTLSIVYPSCTRSVRLTQTAVRTLCRHRSASVISVIIIGS